MDKTPQFQSITRYVSAGTNPFMDVPLSGGISVPAPQTLSQNESTLNQPCPLKIPDPNPAITSWWYQFGYWLVVGGATNPKWGFDNNGAPSVQMADRDVTTYAVYYYSGGPVDPRTGRPLPDSTAVLLDAVDFTTGQSIANSGNFFNVLSDQNQQALANGSAHEVITQNAPQQIEAVDHVGDYFFLNWIIIGTGASVAGSVVSAGAMQTVRAIAVYTNEREDLRFIRGTVDKDGNKFAGKGFTSARQNPGLYKVQFDYSFPSPPSATATQVFNGNSKSSKPFDLTAADGTGGDSRDNAVIVWITTNAMLIRVGDSDGDAKDRPFSFIVAGPQSST